MSTEMEILCRSLILQNNNLVNHTYLLLIKIMIIPILLILLAAGVITVAYLTSALPK